MFVFYFVSVPCRDFKWSIRMSGNAMMSLVSTQSLKYNWKSLLKHLLYILITNTRQWNKSPGALTYVG